jgi:hypothetical protein
VGNKSRLPEFAGTFVGEEIVSPSPWAPRGGPAIARIHARMVLRGAVLVTDYVEERDGKVIFEGHGVYTCEANDLYRMYWFDTSGPGPDAPIEGRWVGDTLTFEGATAKGRIRYVYNLDPEGYTFRIEHATSGAAAILMQGKYRRQA